MLKKIMLIDGNSIINRAFFALPALTNSKGEFTGGVYGFLNIFFKMYDEEKPDFVCVAFDLPKPTSRHIKYSEYKGTRGAMPDNLRPQIPMLKELLRLMNISVYEQEGLEADDILGSLAVKSEADGLNVVVVSGDRDLLQIASDNIKIKIPKTKAGKTVVEEYYAKDVIELFGVTPKEYIDVKGLMGDSSDNIPGVKGIGEKTALKIITEYKSIENAIENAQNIKPQKAGENLAEFKDMAILSKDLATIITDADLEIPTYSVEERIFFNEDSVKRFTELGFKTFLSRAPKEESPQKTNEDFQFCDTHENRQALMKTLLESKGFSVSLINTSGENEGISFYLNEKGFYIPFDENYMEKDFAADFAKVFTAEKNITAYDSKIIRLMFFKNETGDIHIDFDTVLAAYVLNSSRAGYSYDSVAYDYLNENYPSEEEIFGKGKSKISLKDADREKALQFACLQALVAYKTRDILAGRIENNNQNMLYYEIELPTAIVLASMEYWGIKVNKKALMEFNDILTGKIDILTGEIYKLSGREFNINSPKQLGEILFDENGLNLKGGKKTKTGYSTAADVLERLKNTHPVIAKILEFRTLSKLKSTYCDGLLNVLDEKTQKIYSTFNQTVTATGRLSSTEPNLQNIPVKTELGRELRKIFIPTDEKFIFADADYSQIELRVLAHMADDEAMIAAFNNNEDIHASTAARLNGIPLEEVSGKQRSDAKAVNFGIVYGKGAFSLADDLEIGIKEAENYIDSYFNKYYGIKQYMTNSVAEAKGNGYSSTIFGRRREITELKSSNFHLRASGERMAMNMPIQGTAADIMKLAMIKVYNALKEKGLKSRIILQVHDELLLETLKEEKEEVCALLKNEMENAAKMKVSLLAEVHTGETWYEAK